MTEGMTSDYDRVIVQLKLAVKDDSGLSTADRLTMASDLADLLDQGTHWTRVFARNPERPGTWHNLALMTWVGFSIERRLPYVFNALGLGRAS